MYLIKNEVRIRNIIYMKFFFPVHRAKFAEVNFDWKNKIL